MDKYIVKMPFPGHAQDIVRDGNLMFSGLTVEEYLKDNPSMKHKMHTELFTTAFVEITLDQWDDALESMPPMKWHGIKPGIQVFFHSEAMSGLIHGLYLKDKNTGKCYSCNVKITSTDEDILRKYTAEVLNQVH